MQSITIENCKDRVFGPGFCVDKSWVELHCLLFVLFNVVAFLILVVIADTLLQSLTLAGPFVGCEVKAMRKCAIAIVMLEA